VVLGARARPARHRSVMQKAVHETIAVFPTSSASAGDSQLVVRQTRYVGLEFGIHGTSPIDDAGLCAQVRRLQGQGVAARCPLREIGVPATLVIVRTRRGGDLAAYPASLACLRYALAYVRKYDLWLDGTPSTRATSESPRKIKACPC